MIADGLGVHNLSQQPGRIARTFWSRLRGSSPEALPWKPWVTALLSVYSVLSFSVWGLFLWFVLPFFASRILAYPKQVFDFVTALLSGSPAPVAELAVSTYMFLLAAFILGRLGHGWMRQLWSLVRRILSKVSPAKAEQRGMVA